MASRALRFAFVLAPAACALACPEPQFPGNELATFDFTADIDPGATPPDQACTFEEMPTESFTFTGTFSQDSEGSLFFTLGGFDRSATFDGQVMRSSASAPRQFGACNCADVTVEETLTVALLSRSQRDALADPSCPPNPLSGGVPAPNGTTITPPGPTESGFDAVLACGELIDRVLPDPMHCTCAECFLRFPVRGDRR